MGELLPILGTVGLLGLWLYQQTIIESRSSEQRKLEAAVSVYQTYQSNNAVFNAVIANVPIGSDTYREIRKFQLHNYELGLRALEEALPASGRRGVPSRVDAYDVFADQAMQMNRVQARLEKLQDAVKRRQELIRAERAGATARFVRWYVALSVLSVLGAACKLLVKLSEASERVTPR